MHITIVTRSMHDPVAKNWAARLWENGIQCLIATMAEADGTHVHKIRLNSAYLKITQKAGQPHHINLGDITAQQLDIVNLLVAAGVIQSIGINGQMGDTIQPFTEAEARRRFWVLSLQIGDKVNVPYSRAPEDIIRMTVVDKQGGWLSLVPEGKADTPEYRFRACAVNGWTQDYRIPLEQPDQRDSMPQRPIHAEITKLEEVA